MTDFDERIGLLVNGLNLPESVHREGFRVCELIREGEGVRNGFSGYGGFDALVCVSVFLGARQCGVPLLAERVTGFVAGSPDFSVARVFDADKLRRVSRRYRSVIGVDPVFLSASDFVEYYFDGEFDDWGQSEVCELFEVSEHGVRNRYKSVVESLTSVDTSNQPLKDFAVTPASFGFFGDGGCKEFALFLCGEFEGGGRPQVLAAATVYIAGVLMR